MKFTFIFALLLFLSSSEITNYSDLVMARIYQFHLDALIIFQGDSSKEYQAYQELKKFDANSPNLTIVIILKSQNQNSWTKLSNYYGIDVTQTPQILYLSNEKKKFRFLSQKITAVNIESFIVAAKDGTISNYYKSEALHQENNKNIIKVVGKSFKEIVLDNDKQILVYFYGPKCGRCKHFTPDFYLIAQRQAHNSSIVFAKFDVTMNEYPSLEIQSLPSIILWKQDKKSSPLKYTGKYKYEFLLEWLKKNTEFSQVQSNQNIEEIL